ncbi:MAG: DUF58 domain-containing protein [Congregibacter sp.]
MLTIDSSLPAQGAQTSLSRLLALRFPAQQLDIRRRRRALAQLAGGQHSNFRGRGIEFEEVRGYQPGDDIRAIDWRVTARTGEAHTKLFHEERERPVLLAVDQRTGMQFGSQHCFKGVLAAELAALLAWSALSTNERVGALLMYENRHWEMRPRNNRRTVLSILSALAEHDPDENAQEPETTPALSFADMLRSARRVARPGTSVFIVSDFAGADESRAREELFQLARHCEITAIHCTDPLERELPPAGRYAVTDGKARAELDTRFKDAKTQFSADFDTVLEFHREQLQRLGIPLLLARTDTPPVGLLRRFYGEGRT